MEQFGIQWTMLVYITKTYEDSLELRISPHDIKR